MASERFRPFVRGRQRHFHVALSAGQEYVSDGYVFRLGTFIPGFDYQPAAGLCLLRAQHHQETAFAALSPAFRQQGAAAIRQPRGNLGPFINRSENPDFLPPAEDRPVRKKACRFQHVPLSLFMIDCIRDGVCHHCSGCGPLVNNPVFFPPSPVSAARKK